MIFKLIHMQTPRWLNSIGFCHLTALAPGICFFSKTRKAFHLDLTRSSSTTSCTMSGDLHAPHGPLLRGIKKRCGGSSEPKKQGVGKVGNGDFDLVLRQFITWSKIPHQVFIILRGGPSKSGFSLTGELANHEWTQINRTLEGIPSVIPHDFSGSTHLFKG